MELGLKITDFGTFCQACVYVSNGLSNTDIRLESLVVEFGTSEKIKEKSKNTNEEK